MESLIEVMVYPVIAVPAVAVSELDDSVNAGLSTYETITTPLPPAAP